VSGNFCTTAVSGRINPGPWLPSHAIGCGADTFMGLNINEVKFLLGAKAQVVDFTSMVMIGRQRLYLNRNSLRSTLAAFGIHKTPAEVEQLFSEQQGYAEPFFKLLGAKEPGSIDASAYEGASQVWDMNQPVPETLKDKFSLVLDGGSLEHVFNFPTAIKNCMEMVRVGGQVINITPGNNYLGHGFYQFSPELFFRIYNEANGFKLEKLVLFETAPLARWYAVRDPELMGKRVEARTRRQTLLIVQARRTAIKPLFSLTPQQSDYSVIWRGSGAGGPAGKSGGPAPQAPLATRIIMKLPYGLKKPFWQLKEWWQPKMNPEGFEEI